MNDWTLRDIGLSRVDVTSGAGRLVASIKDD